MNMVDRLLDQLAKRGLRVEPGDRPGELTLRGATREASPELLRALKAFKPQLVARFGKREAMPGGDPPPPREGDPDPDPEPESTCWTCSACSRVTTSREDLERLKDPAFCDRGRGPRCPHK